MLLQPVEFLGSLGVSGFHDHWFHRFDFYVLVWSFISHLLLDSKY
jgi:hypothetical protein